MVWVLAVGRVSGMPGSPEADSDYSGLRFEENSPVETIVDRGLRAREELTDVSFLAGR